MMTIFYAIVIIIGFILGSICVVAILCLLGWLLRVGKQAGGLYREVPSVFEYNPIPTPQVPKDEWNKWGGEIAANGALSDETREAIKKQYGIPDDILNSYVKCVRLKQKEAVASAAKTVGGAQNLKDIFAWATENLTDKERESVNESLKRPGWQNVLLDLKDRVYYDPSGSFTHSMRSYERCISRADEL